MFGYVVRLVIVFILDGEIGNTLSRKVLFMLNSNLSISRLARFYFDLGIFNRWIILSLISSRQDLYSDHWI
jgi:hypothetical protein